MKKILLSIFAVTFLMNSAQAEIIDWQSSGKNFSYAVAGAGALLSLGGNYSKSIRKDAFGRKVIGITMITLAAQIFYLEVATDVTAADRRLWNAEHRNLVRYAKDVEAEKPRLFNSNFDELLSEFECDLDDDQKAIIFAQLIKQADELGAQAHASGPLTDDVETEIQAKLEQSLGNYNTIRNQILIKYIVAQSFLNKVQQASK